MSVIELKVPQIGEAVREVTVNTILKPNGTFVERDEIICLFDSDKASIEVPAEQAGVINWTAQEGDDLAIGAVFAHIDTAAANTEQRTAPPEKLNTEHHTAPPEKPNTEKSQPETYASNHPSPAARKLMDEKQLSAAQIQASGKDGRIRKDDVLKAAETRTAQAETRTTNTETRTANTATRTERTEKMSRMRRTIAKRLVSAKNNTAMLTTFNEADMTAIMELRKKYQDDFLAKYGIKLGFMSIFAKACAKVLMEMPEVNAQIGEDGNHIKYHDYADISIAVSTPTGLVVPPIRNAEKQTLPELEKSIAAVAKKAREGALTLEEMTGGTFTITNGGVFGSMMSTPIINEPQSAILGMHAIIERPVAINGQVLVRPMMYLALSYDHRIIDGSTSVTFLVKVKKLLEDPTRLFLDL